MAIVNIAIVELRLAFLNCHNHFTVRAAASRGPADARDYALKVAGLATVLKDCFRPASPDLFGLCEVGSPTAVRDILHRFRHRNYDLVWQKPPARRHPGGEPRTGLAVCFDRDLLDVEQTVRSEMTVAEGRYHWYAVQIRVRSNNQLFWFVVNHWPSDLRSGQVRGTWPRAQVAAAVGEFAAREFASGAGRMVLAGDFNCEPFDAPMTGSATLWTDRLVSTRERARASSAAKRLPHFYNLMWRHLGELHPHPDGTAADRPPGTFRYGDAWRCLDQILVSRSLLDNTGIAIRESSVAVIVPRRGGTDHCAVAAILDYT